MKLTKEDKKTIRKNSWEILKKKVVRISNYMYYISKKTIIISDLALIASIVLMPAASLFLYICLGLSNAIFMVGMVIHTCYLKKIFPTSIEEFKIGPISIEEFDGILDAEIKKLLTANKKIRAKKRENVANMVINEKDDSNKTNETNNAILFDLVKDIQDSPLEEKTKSFLLLRIFELDQNDKIKTKEEYIKEINFIRQMFNTFSNKQKNKSSNISSKSMTKKREK